MCICVHLCKNICVYDVQHKFGHQQTGYLTHAEHAADYELHFFAALPPVGYRTYTLRPTHPAPQQPPTAVPLSAMPLQEDGTIAVGHGPAVLLLSNDTGAQTLTMCGLIILTSASSYHLYMCVMAFFCLHPPFTTTHTTSSVSLSSSSS